MRRGYCGVPNAAATEYQGSSSLYVCCAETETDRPLSNAIGLSSLRVVLFPIFDACAHALDSTGLAPDVGVSEANLRHGWPCTELFILFWMVGRFSAIICSTGNSLIWLFE